MSVHISRRLATVAAFAALALSTSAQAELAVGAKAPDFTAKGALAGKEISFTLSKALKKGPVVLYFYPKAFTQGCTLEAHAFAEATPEFAKAGAKVIGMSNDDIATLQKFSKEACRDQFTVASASPQVVAGYDVALKPRPGMPANMPSGLTSRTSYVIGKNGKVLFVHSNMDWRDHVRLTLDAVKRLKAGK
ncbi:MAG: peroxiredoxin [Novosphingobium sp.]